MTYKEWKSEFVDGGNKSGLENGENVSPFNFGGRHTFIDSGIIENNTTEDGEKMEIHFIGKIDRKIYSCITEDIVTDEVIITNERIAHIKNRHPNDYEKYYKYLKEIVTDPEYIFLGNKPNSALILKDFSDGQERFKAILRLVTSVDDKNFKNSIITFMKINEKEWNRLLRNKKILYKKE